MVFYSILGVFCMGSNGRGGKGLLCHPLICLWYLTLCNPANGLELYSRVQSFCLHHKKTAPAAVILRFAQNDDLKSRTMLDVSFKGGDNFHSYYRFS